MSLGNQIAQHFKIGAAGDSFGDELMINELAKRISLDPAKIMQMRPQIEEEIERARIFLKSNRKGQSHAH